MPTFPPKNFNHKWMLKFIKRIFCISWDVYIIFCVFCLCFLFDLLSCISFWLICRYWKSLHPWDKSHLIMVYTPINVLLDSVCWYYVEDFGFYVHQWYWPVILFFVWYLCLSLVSPWWRPHRVSLEVFLSLQFFGISFRMIGVNCSLNIWQSSLVKQSCPGL